MSDEPKKIIVDDDWKAEAKREKEELKEQTAEARQIPEPTFAELVNILVMQTMAALGLLTGPGGQRVPPDLNAAKHFVDMLQLLEDKTKNNLTDEEKNLLDQVLYETRMAFVQIAGAGGAAPGAAPTPPPAAPDS